MARAEVQDPVFFAEEFTARRRRYVPINVDISKIATVGDYKNYNFPFITVLEPTGKFEDYPELFKKALETKFVRVDRYKPTSLFEAWTYESYKGDWESLEVARKKFVESLMLPGVLVDLVGVKTIPSAPRGSGDFAIPSDGRSISPKLRSSRGSYEASISSEIIGSDDPSAVTGYLSPKFIHYLREISKDWNTQPTNLCRKVLFEDREDSGKGIDMLPFASMITPKFFGDPNNPAFKTGKDILARPLDYRTNVDAKECNPSPDRSQVYTVEEAYKLLSRIIGKPIERYLGFIRFVYLFFDHIPEVQPVVAALLGPLAGMLGGILLRGRFESRKFNPMDLALKFSKPEAIYNETVFRYADPGLYNVVSRQESARAIISMYKPLAKSSNAIKCLLNKFQDSIPFNVNEDSVRKELLSIPIPEGVQDLARARAIYESSGISDFNLPSSGYAHMILPAVLGIPEKSIVSNIYNLVVSKNSEKFNNNLDLFNQYKTASSDRYGYTVRGNPKSISGESIIKIDLDSVERILPSSSWEEILYPALISELVIDNPIYVESLIKTFVRPLLMYEGYAISIPCDIELQGSLKADISDLDVTKALSEIFQFPACEYYIEYNSSQEESLNKFIVRVFPHAESVISKDGLFSIFRKKLDSNQSLRYSYRLIDRMSVTYYSRAIGSTSSPIAYHRIPLFLRSKEVYIWSGLGLGASDPSMVPRGKLPALTFSGDHPFLPSFENDLFLSSLFDWRQQIVFLMKLLKEVDNADIISVMEDIYIEDLDGGDLITGLCENPSGIHYKWFTNLVYNIIGPDSSNSLSEIIRYPRFVESSSLTMDVKEFYKKNEPTPKRGVLNYNIKLGDYLDLLIARKPQMKSGKVTKKTDYAVLEKNAEIEEWIKRSSRVLEDPYSKVIDEIVIRAMS